MESAATPIRSFATLFSMNRIIGVPGADVKCNKSGD
jgi:hypothetical protein